MLFGETSERKKLEQQRRDDGRLPPGQSLTLKWPVLHEGDVPRTDLRTWISASRARRKTVAAYLGRIQPPPANRKSNATCTA